MKYKNASNVKKIIIITKINKQIKIKIIIITLKVITKKA